MAQRVITVMREQVCSILVDIPDDWDSAKCRSLNADDLTCGIMGLDWENVGAYTIDDVDEVTDESLETVSGETSVMNSK